MTGAVRAESITSKLRENVPGSKVTTYCIGGLIRFLAEPDTENELQDLIRTLKSKNENFRVLGAGSNLLIPDAGVNETVIRLGKGFRFWEQLGEGRIKVGGSMPLISLSQETAQAGLSGLEFAGGIPASFGGAVRMNAGAHGSDISAVLESARIVDSNGECFDIEAKDLQFSYRHSNIPDRGIVIGGILKLVPGDKEKILKLRADNLAHRKAVQPITLPSAGSIFKNPPGALSAGKLIEQAGLKGFRVGGAHVSELHGNWIVNAEREAKSVDVEACIDECKKRVKESSRINLETELIRW